MDAKPVEPGRKEHMEYVNLEPTQEGYTNIAKMFAESLLSDVRKGRKYADAQLLTSLVDIVASLSVGDRGDLVAEIRAHILRLSE